MALLRRLRQVDAANNGLDKLCIQVDSILDYNAEAVVMVDVTGTPVGTAGNPIATVGGAGSPGGPPALATAAAPTYGEGAAVALSVDLAGNLRTLGGGGGGATTDVTDRAARLVGHVTVDNFPATQPVSGTVTATGPLTDTQLRAAAVPVNGTFWQATQPVSGTVAVSSVPAPAVLSPGAPTAVSVGVASGAAVTTNANRKGLVLTNTSANAISLGLGAAAVLNSGITLNANGGVWVMDQFTFTTAAINAIAGGAASNLAIQEFS